MIDNLVDKQIEEKVRELYDPLCELMNLLHEKGILLDKENTLRITTIHGPIYFGGGEVNELKYKAYRYDQLMEHMENFANESKNI